MKLILTFDLDLRFKFEFNVLLFLFCKFLTEVGLEGVYIIISLCIKTFDNIRIRKFILIQSNNYSRVLS